jgi:hypothetical protein
MLSIKITLPPHWSPKCLPDKKYFFRFEVLTSVTMTSIIFWDVTPNIVVQFYWRFGETYRLHLQCLRASQWSNHEESSGKQSRLASCFFLLPWLTSSSALKMRAVRSSEIVTNFYGTTQHRIPEDGILLYDHVCNVTRHIYGHWYIWYSCVPGLLSS